MTYKDVFQLAENKGYKSTVNTNSLFAERNPVEFEILSITLIQKWLRDTHKIYVDPTPYNAVSIYGRNFKESKWVQVYVPTEYDEKEIKFDSYESALLEGINAALQLI
jgi:hypothetical protein